MSTLAHAVSTVAQQAELTADRRQGQRRCDRRRLRLRPRRHRPGHRHRLPRRPGRAGHGPPARVRRHGATTMFLGIAFTEALALIGFVVFILLKFA